MTKQPVLIIGGTGRTGSSIVNGLLDSKKFDLVAGVRPSSELKPEVNALKARGVNIRILDLANWTVEQIAESLTGIDTVVSAISYYEVSCQKVLADACKLAGVKRFVPSDWATPQVRGVCEYFDEMLEIHEYIKKVGIGYTFIDVGWWMEIMSPEAKAFHPLLGKRYGTGDVKCAVTARKDIGKFAARVIADERTLNHYVFCWTQEVTQNEGFALFERTSGQKVNIESISADELAGIGNDPSRGKEKVIAQHLYSIFIRGDNVVENAKKEEYGGALDARELYLDIAKELTSLEELAKQHYAAAAA